MNGDGDLTPYNRAMRKMLLGDENDSQRQQFINILTQMKRNPAIDQRGRWEQLNTICDHLSIVEGARCESDFDDASIVRLGDYVESVLFMIRCMNVLRSYGQLGAEDRH